MRKKGMKMTFMKTSEPQKWRRPRASFIARPVALGNQ